MAELQSVTVRLKQVGYQARALGRMNLGSIHHYNHAAFAAGRSNQTLFDQLTERSGIPFLGTDSHDRPGAPIRGRTLLPLGRTHAGSPDAALLAAEHPHPSQGREQAQLGLIEHVHIRPTRRVP